METWVIVLSAVLVLFIVGVIIAVIYKQQTNKTVNQNNILYPFVASINPGDSTAFLKNSLGTSQIDCSAVGGTVNIVGAWVETIDSYGECSGNSGDALNLTCGVRTSKVPCRQDSDCGAGMGCSGGVCTPGLCPITKGDNFDSSKCSCGGNYCPIRPGAKCNTNTDCNDQQGVMMTCNSGTCTVNPGQLCTAPDPYQGQFCATYPLCSNSFTTKNSKGNDTIINYVCNPLGPCRPRDSSAYLAGLCDGKQTCNVLFDPSDTKSGFGPVPCDTTVMPGTGNYNRLPNIPGQAGTFSQGFYVHGLYTCILPD